MPEQCAELDVGQRHLPAKVVAQQVHLLVDGNVRVELRQQHIVVRLGARYQIVTQYLQLVFGFLPNYCAIIILIIFSSAKCC